MVLLLLLQGSQWTGLGKRKSGVGDHTKEKNRCCRARDVLINEASTNPHRVSWLAQQLLERPVQRKITYQEKKNLLLKGWDMLYQTGQKNVVRKNVRKDLGRMRMLK